MPRIFISYRRQDSAAAVGRIYDRLVARFGPDEVFMDVDSIPFGEDFRALLNAAVGRCDVFLAVIGRRWMGRTKTGRRIDDPRDFVRIEVEAGLSRDLPVIPVLVDDARMPGEADLPASLAPLAYRNALEVDVGRDFDHHVDRLIRSIERRFASKSSNQSPSRVASVAATGAAQPREVESTTSAEEIDSGPLVAPQPRLQQPGPPIEKEPTAVVAPQILVPPREFTNSIGMKFVRIEPGTYLRGSTKEQMEKLLKLYPDASKDWLEWEQPQHEVAITKPFHLGIHQVTVGQFRKFVEETKYQTEAEKSGRGSYYWSDAGKWELDPKKNWRDPGFDPRQGDDHPVVCVSWNDAVAFCQWLTDKKHGWTYRLPTEAEWEYARRAGTTALYLISDNPQDLVKIANVQDASTKRKFPNTECIQGDSGFVYTAPVGKFVANGWGLHDMIGNVWEWCGDGYDEKEYKKLGGSGVVPDPVGLPEASDRAFRGGSWLGGLWSCRPACRPGFTPRIRYFTHGFRVAAVQSSAE